MNSSTSGIQIKTGENILRQLIVASWVVLGIAALYQLVMFNDIVNTGAVAVVMIAWLLASNIWLRRAMLESYLISSFILLGFVLCQFFFPLVFTTIENKPLIYNLELPEEVFLHTSLCLLVLIFTHMFYRFLKRFSANRSSTIMEKAGFFEPPTHLQVWLIGLIGMASSLYVYVGDPNVSREMTGGAGGKILQALVPLSYAPFFIPLSKFYGNKNKPHNGYLTLIILYTILLLAVSMARNSRGAFIMGLTTPVFAYGLGILLGVFETKIFTFKNIAVCGAIVWLLAGPLSDLGTAMLIVRGGSKEIQPGELIAETIQTMGDKKAIEARNEGDRVEHADFDWDELYLDNLYTARFANIKFNDNSLVLYNKMGMYDPEMIQLSLDYLLASLPDPILKIFKIDIDKEAIITFSFADLLYVETGGIGPLEAYRVGSISGIGMATIGWWYLMFFGLVMIPVFYLTDALYRKRSSSPSNIRLQPEDRFTLSFCAMMALTSFFQFLQTESLVHIANYYFRGWFQMVVLYFLAFQFCRIATRLIIPKKTRGFVNRSSPTGI